MKIVISVLLCWTSLSSVLGDCTFWRENDCAQDSARTMLNLLTNAKIEQPMTVTDSKGIYTYEIGICQSVGAADKDAGVVQYNLQTDPEKKKPTVIGRISNTSAIAWDHWMFLDYRQGDKYGTHCSGEKRTARLMFTCAKNQTKPLLRVVEEKNDKSTDCYYMFEIQHQVMCQDIIVHNVGSSGKLSVGSVLLIIFFTCVVGYLIIGAAYQRFVAGAKGIDQIPHLSFWQDFGNLQADGCDFVCRGLGKSRNSREYRGIGEDQAIPNYESDTNRDDSLLPM